MKFHIALLSLFILSAGLLAPAVSAGTAADPEVSDATGDQAETEGGALDNDEDFSDIDVMKAWFSEADMTSVQLSIETEVAPLADSRFTSTFRVSAGPASEFGSTAAGEEYTIVSDRTTLVSGPASQAALAGTVLTYTIPRSAIGSVGGDLLTDLVISTTRTFDGCPAPGVPPFCIDQTGTDRAPDTGVGRTYPLSRPAIVGSADVTFVDGFVLDIVPDGNGNFTGPAAVRPFDGSSASTQDANATVTYNATLVNDGTDRDTFHAAVLSAAVLAQNGITATVTPADLTLDPGQSGSLSIVLDLANATLGEHGVLLEVTSDHGASSLRVALLQLLAPPSPPGSEETATPTPTATPTTTADPGDGSGAGDGRDPVLGAGTFLQDAAEGLRFDAAFGDWAEIVFVALLLLLVVLIVFLLLLLAGGTWIGVAVSPATATVGPGGTAEFEVRVHNRKRRFHDALAYFEDASGWKTGVLLAGEAGAAPLTRPGQETGLKLGAREEPGDLVRGTMKVQVPANAPDGASDRVTLHVVPVDASGQERVRHGGTAHVTVRSHRPGPVGAVAAAGHTARHLATPSAVPVRLSSVEHSPREPAAGDTVMTRATVENDSTTETLRLRVVLQLDGQDREEETIAVPPRSARAVLFPWRAGAGSNEVRVQVYLA